MSLIKNAQHMKLIQMRNKRINDDIYDEKTLKLLCLSVFIYVYYSMVYIGLRISTTKTYEGEW